MIPKFGIVLGYRNLIDKIYHDFSLQVNYSLAFQNYFTFFLLEQKFKTKRCFHATNYAHPAFLSSLPLAQNKFHQTVIYQLLSYKLNFKGDNDKFHFRKLCASAALRDILSVYKRLRSILFNRNYKIKALSFKIKKLNLLYLQRI